MITLEEFKDEYNWYEALTYAGKDRGYFGISDPPMPSPVTDTTMDCTPFGMEDVAEVIHAVEGEPDGTDWRCALRLNDGRYAYVEAGCDYTGWD